MKARAPVSRVFAGVRYGLRVLFRPARGAVGVERRRARLRWVLAIFAVLGAVIAAMFFIDINAAQFADRLPDGLVRFFRIYTHLGLYEAVLVPLAVLLLSCAFAGARTLPPMQQRLLAALAVRLEFLFLAVALPGIVSGIVKRVIGRARPLTIEGDVFSYRPFDWTDAYASLPSGHTTAAFAVLVAFGALWPRLLPLLWIYAIGIGVSRVTGSFHHFSDVIAGAFAGAAGALLVREYFAARGLAFVRTTDGHIAPKAGPSRKRFAALLRKAAGN